MLFRRRAKSRDVDVRALHSRLEEAAVWCASLLDASRGLCASELLPPRGEAEILEEKSSGLATPGFTPTTAGSRLALAPHALVASVVAARARRMAEHRLTDSNSSDHLPSSGRVLCCGVNASLDDRACHIESRGFLDEDDLPPCDTWFAVVPLEYLQLLAWVPERHVADVDAAMPCCPTEAYRWLAHVDARLERALLRGR